MQFFIFKTVRCVWVQKIDINALLFFCPAWDSFSSEKVLYVITKQKNVREKATKCSLKTNEVLLVADGHVLTCVWSLSRYSSSKSF